MKGMLLHVWLALACASWLVLGCAARVDLSGTRWSIVSIDQIALAGSPSLLFHADGNRATLSLECGDITLDWAWDTDGSALGFGTTVIPAECQSPTAADAAIRDAAVATDEWSVEADTAITLHGQNVVRLERP